MSRQDQVIDDDEPETCPLCIEELDLSDRGFRPCPCGYQVCQFCYNNIKTTMNSLCPACRRVYDDKNIRFDAPSVEEVAKYKENKAHQDKKKAAAKRQEAASRQADTLSRKHLAGIRVRRQNLVYVTGLRLQTSEPLLSDKLRGEQYFGQYGKIDKVVVNKPKDSRALQPVGVYITYFEKEAAALCISMVNGSLNGGGMIKADYGTTKYCSAFLRHETCSNKNCTFLHEVGEDNESFTREGLSSLNAISATNQVTQSATQSSSLPQPPQPSQIPVHHTPLFSQTSDRPESREGNVSVAGSTDSSALPSTVSWANRNATSRRPSQTQSFASASPMVSNAEPAAAIQLEPQTEIQPADEAQQEMRSDEPATLKAVPSIRARRPIDPIILQLKKILAEDELNFVYDDSYLSQEDRAMVEHMPLLFDPNGGAKRYQARQREAERQRMEKDAQVASQALSAIDVEDSAEGGSLQLGGEPEDRHAMEISHRQNLAVQPPTGDLMSPPFSIAHALSPAPHVAGLNARSPAPQLHQQHPMQPFKSSSPGLLSHTSDQTQPAPNSQHGGGHARQNSRFTFGDEGASGSSSARPSSRTKFLNQQSSMLSPSNHYAQGSSGNQFFSSGIQGPPPGLKATGTPPVSGGGMFGQGHGFATAGLGYGATSASRNSNEEMLRELMRTRGGSAGSGQTSEGGRRESMFSSPVHHSQIPSIYDPGLSSFSYGSYPGAFQDRDLQKQKKKGKKRHANTSSSGRGLVDLADPSILQSRMHQASGIGQNHYGSQGQGQDQLPSSFGQGDPFISTSDETFAAFSGGLFGINVRRSIPSLPPGLASNVKQAWSTRTPQLFQSEPRPSYDGLPSIAGLGTAPTSLELQNSRIERRLRVEHELPKLPAAGQSAKPVVTAVDPGLASSITTLDEVSFPALPRPSSLKPASSGEKKSDLVASSSSSKAPNKLLLVRKTDAQPSRPQLEKSVPKLKQTAKDLEISRRDHKKEDRQNPGTLDISLARAFARKDAAKVEEAIERSSTPVQTSREQSSTPLTASSPVTPALSADTPARRVTSPSILRVDTRPTVGTPPLVSAMSSSSATQHSTARASPSTSRQTSRRPSIASMSVAETTTSEKIPDDVSIITGITSRAGSPQGSRVGSAPVRSKTKSQAKKERQERGKTLVEEQSVAGSVSSEATEIVKQEPIMGRKKRAKVKKAPTVPTTASNTPEASRPHSPEPPATQPEEQVGVIEEAEHHKLATPTIDETEEPEPVAKLDVQLPPVRDPLNPAAVLAELEAIDPSDLARITDLFLRSTIQTGGKSEHLTADDIWSMATPKTLTPVEVAALNRGEPVRREGIGGKASSRLMISPTKKCLPRLTRELEDRYLELEERIQGSRPPAKYTHHRKEATQILATIDDMLQDMTAILTRPPKSNSGTPNQIPAISPQFTRRVSSTSADNTKPTIQPPASPSYASDALAYLNQFILPPLPNASRSALPVTAPTNKVSSSALTTAQSTPIAPVMPVGSLGPAPTSPLGQALTKTYNTMDSAYSLNGVDVNLLAQSAANAAAAAVGSLNPADFGLDLAALSQLSQGVANSGAGANAELGMGITQASLNAAVKGLSNLSGAGAGGSTTSHSSVNTETIRQALANAVNGVVQAAAAVAGLPHNTSGGLQNQALTGAGSVASAGTAAQQALRGMGLSPKIVSVEEAEQALLGARKESEALEKRMAGLVKRNRKTAGLV